jgi:hypothetical protein
MQSIYINLSGPQGNAFSLIALANNLWLESGKKFIDFQSIKEEMTSGDYDNLKNVLQKYFPQVKFIE